MLERIFVIAAEKKESKALLVEQQEQMRAVVFVQGQAMHDTETGEDVLYTDMTKEVDEGDESLA